MIDLTRGIIYLHGKSWPIMRRLSHQVDMILPGTANPVFNRVIRSNEVLIICDTW